MASTYLPAYLSIPEVKNLKGLSKAGTSNSIPEPALVACETTDVNRDGYSDIILTYAGTENTPLKILAGSSLGDYTDISAGSLPNLDIAVPVILKTADVDSDGDPDILLVTPGRIEINAVGITAGDYQKNYVLVNSGSGVFTEKAVGLFGSDFAYTPAIDIQVRDFSQDGRNDALLLNPQESALYVNTDTGFTKTQYTEEARPEPRGNKSISMDINGDGQTDTILIQNGKPVIQNPLTLKPLNPITPELLNSSYISPWQYKITGPNGSNNVKITKLGDIVYFEFDSMVPDYVWGNILISFDPAKLRCVSIEENPDNWYGFWTWWTPATAIPQYGGGGTSYYYDDTGRGSDWAKTWVNWYGQGAAGPVGSYDNAAGKIWLYTSTEAGQSYTAPLRIGFEVLHTSPMEFRVQSNDFTHYDWMTLDDGVVSVVDVSIESPVRIDAVTPDIGCAGNTEQVVITGVGFTPDMAVSFGEGVAVNVLDIQPDRITAEIAVSATAGLGTRAISVGTVIKENAFTVMDIQVTGDQYTPLGTGDNALFQAVFLPEGVLSGREISYQWQVKAGTGTLIQTETLSPEYIPAEVETAIIGFTLNTSGAIFTEETEVNVWDFEFIIGAEAPIPVIAKPSAKPQGYTALMQLYQVEQAGEVAVLAKEKTWIMVVFRGKISDETNVNTFQIVENDPNKPVIEFTQDPEDRKSGTIYGIGIGSAVINADVTEKADANGKAVNKVISKTVYVIEKGAVDPVSGEKWEIKIEEKDSLESLLVGGTKDFIAYAILNNQQKLKIPLIIPDWKIDQGKAEYAKLVYNASDPTIITLQGISVGSVRLEARYQDGAEFVAKSNFIQVYNIDLKIYDGQNGKEVDEGVEESDDPAKTGYGAFTVVNWNNTNNNYDPNNNNIEIVDSNETNTAKEDHDLMRLDINVIIPNFTDAKAWVRYSLVAEKGGAKIRIWKDAMKKEEIVLPLAPAPPVQVFEIPTPLWIEGIDKSDTIRDIKLTLTCTHFERTLTDSVNATLVWAEKTGFRNGKVVPLTGPSTDAGTELKSVYRNNFKEGVNNQLGIVGPGNGLKIVNHMEMEFTVYPPGIGSESKVKFDIARQEQYGRWSVRTEKTIINGISLFNPIQLKTDKGDGFPTHNEDVNSDKDNKYDNSDNLPTNNHIYSDHKSGLYDTIVDKNDDNILFKKCANYYEFVRVRVDSAEPANNKKDGSRCSSRIAWRSIVASTNLLPPQNPPVVSGRINQQGISTPVSGPVDMTVTTDSYAIITADWEIQFKGNGQWKILCKSFGKDVEGVSQTAISGQPYSAMGVSFTIPAGSYQKGDVFKFSTIGSFKNEIELEHRTVPVKP